MATNTAQLQNPSVQSQYEFNLETAAGVDAELPVAIIAPHYTVVPAFDSTGALSESAKVGTVSSNRERLTLSKILATEPTRFSLPQATTATRVDRDDVRIFGSSGVGSSRQTFELSPKPEVILRSGSGRFVAAAGSADVTLTDVSANFPSLVRRQGLQLLDRDVRRPHLYVRIASDSGLLAVDLTEVSELSRTVLPLLRARSGNANLPAVDTNVDYALVYSPDLFSISDPNAPAEARLFSVTRQNLDTTGDIRRVAATLPGTASVPTSAGSVQLLNVSTTALTVVFTADGTPLSVDTSTPEVIGIKLTTGTNTLTSINDALISEYAPASPPVYFNELEVAAGATVASAAAIELGPDGDGIIPMDAAVQRQFSMYSGALSGEVTVDLTSPTARVDALGFTGSGATVGVTLPGRSGLIMSTVGPGSVLELLDGINERLRDNLVNLAHLQSADVQLQMRDQERSDLAQYWLLSAPIATRAHGCVLLNSTGAAVSAATLYAQKINAVVELVASAPGVQANGRQILQYALGTVAAPVSVDSETGAIGLSYEVDLLGSVVSGPTFANLAAALALTDDGTGSPIYEVGRCWVRSTLTGEMVLAPFSSVSSSAISYGALLGEATLRGYDSVAEVVADIPIATETTFEFGSTAATLILDEHLLYAEGNGLPIHVYAGYRALRMDTTAETSLEVYGRAPEFVRVTRSTYTAILGAATESNPISMLAGQFFATSPDVTLFCLGVSETGATGTGEEMGTVAALEAALDFARRRAVYHVGIFSSSTAVLSSVCAFADQMAGSANPSNSLLAARPRKKPLYLYLPQSPLTQYPDVSVEEGEVTFISGSDRRVLRTSLVADQYNVADLAAGRLVIVFNDFPELEDGDVAVDGNRRGIRISASSVGGNAYAIQLSVALPIAVEPGAGFQILRKGVTLINRGVYDHALATEAHEAYHDVAERKHFSVTKVFSDGMVVTFNGVERTLGPEYWMARVLGMVAANSQMAPLNNVQAVGVKRMLGTSKLFTGDEELPRLAGRAGLLFAIQEGGDDSPVVIFRDVSSDTSNTVFQRRTAKVTDDLLDLRIKRAVQPKLTGAVISPTLFNILMMAANPLVEAMAEHYDYLELEGFRPLTDAERTRFSTTERGVVAVTRRTHRDEVGVVILNNIITE